MEKKKVLFVGEHPCGTSGNSHMLNAVLKQIDPNKHDFSVFAATSAGIPFLIKSEYQIIEGGLDVRDAYGCRLLLEVINTNPVDVLIFVGLDCWIYYGIYNQLIELKKRKKFIWCSIFPYDSHFVRKDWITLLSHVDIPCVYSEYGYSKLEKYVNPLFYYRPPLHEANKFVPFSPKEKSDIRRKLLHVEDDEKFIFGFFGKNQFRKDPLRLIHAFYEVKKEFPNIGLYLHTEKQGVYNIDQYVTDCNGELGDMYVKKQNFGYTTESLVKSYNMVDCYVNVSYQEGLSWTVLEAMLCGVPCIVSDNTAHTELADEGAALKVPSTDLAFLPVSGAGGPTFMETRACHVPTLVYLMKSMIKQKELRKTCSEKGLARAKEWLKGVSNVNEILRTAYQLHSLPPIQKKKKEKILFMQHSSAGDIFMTTRCLSEIKSRHKNMPLVYMTQKKYQDILVNNPYIDEIIDWDETKRDEYQVQYNPHGDIILPGHWGRNSNSILSDFYWKVLRIEKPGAFFIDKVEPTFLKLKNKLPIMIVHTTGGDPQFRTYKYGKDICDYFRGKYFTVQVGGKNDYPAEADMDLRGLLTFRETAWVVDISMIAVTVDSFISHLCGALGVSQVCLFGSGNHHVVRPNQITGILICRSINYILQCKGLGPCSAGVRDCPTPCTGLHDPKDIIKDLEYIEKIQKSMYFKNTIEYRVSG